MHGGIALLLSNKKIQLTWPNTKLQTGYWEFMEMCWMVLHKLLTTQATLLFNTLSKKGRSKCGTSSLGRNTKLTGVCRLGLKQDFWRQGCSLLVDYSIVSTFNTLMDANER